MKSLIIDDEPMPAKNLASMIRSHCFEIDTIEICLKASKALEILKEKDFDLIFLDIEMPEMTGFDFIRHANLSNNTKVIITTAYEQYAIEAFDINATHYLVKPIKEKDLVKAVRKVMIELKSDRSNHDSASSVISVFDDNEHHIIKEDDIIRLEADGSYTKLYLNDKKLLSSKSIGSYEKTLSKKLFFRTHKSHIVNIKTVVKLNKGRGGYIALSNKDVIPLTESKQASFEKALGLN